MTEFRERSLAAVLRDRSDRDSSERRSSVTVSAASDVYFDPYDIELNADPYPMFRRLREEAQRAREALGSAAEGAAFAPGPTGVEDASVASGVEGVSGSGSGSGEGGWTDWPGRRGWAGDGGGQRRRGRNLRNGR